MVAPADKELIKVKKNVYLSKDNVVTLNTGSVPTFGVFFDGTNNNYDNDKLTDGNDNSPSNITKLWELYKQEEKVDKHYEHGVGTTTGKKNSDLDAGFAYSFGTHLQNGVDALKKFLKLYPHSKQAIIDVFGFSRGAACARAFVNEVLRSTQLDPMFWGGSKPEFRFVGLFDTVGSVGMAGDNSNDNWMIHVGNQLTGPAILDVHEKAVKKLVHLTAADEIREYFPLSSVKSKTSLPGNFIEELWPGAHSDIGGGYGTRPQIYNFKPVSFSDEFELLSYDRKKEILQQTKAVTEQYYPDSGRLRGRKFTYTIEAGDEIPEEDTELNHETVVVPTWKRKSINEICNITLGRMHKLGLESGLPFKAIETLESVEGEVEYKLLENEDGNPILGKNGKQLDIMQTKLVPDNDISGKPKIDNNGNVIMVEKPKRLKTPYKVTDILRRLVTAVRSKGTNSTEYDILYRRYIHISHQYYGGLINANKMESNPNITTANGKREMFYNDPSAAIDPDKYEENKSFAGIHQEDAQYV